jgi:hypothetical protein
MVKNMKSIIFISLFILNAATACTVNTDTGDLQIFPSDNPWNIDISGYPVHPNSESFIKTVGEETVLHPDFGTVWEGAPIGIPFAVVQGTQPRVNIRFIAYPEESDPGPYPVPCNAPIEGGPQSTGDRHVIVIDYDHKKLYELYRAFKVVNGWIADSGAVWDLTSNAVRPKYWTSADAAGLPICAGLVRYEEVATGEITHALRFTVRHTQKGFIYPARHYASDSTDPDFPPMGLRVRLKAEFDASGFSPANQVILTALKKYGMMVADNGSDWFISGAPDSRWNDEDLAQLRQVKGKDFEVVDTGEIEH